MPFEEEVLRIIRQIRLVGREYDTTTGSRERLVPVTSYHIEIRAREIAFVLIRRLKDSAGVARESVRAFLTQAVVLVVVRETGSVSASHLAVRQIASEVIDTRVGRIDVKEVGFHRRCFVEPRLRNRVLFVPGVTHCLLSAIRVQHRKPASGIHIPDRIAIEISLLIIGLQILVIDHCVTFDLIKKRIQNGLRGG